ncbi:MAG: 3-hydroxyacyl-CoA dehydrogenase family protein [Candidatus Aminicenantaceae bacterium]
MKNLDELMENVTVLGAAGKMGSGIALLLAQEMAKLKIKNPDKSYHLYIVDVSEQALDGLLGYLRAQATKAAEKGCVMLRELYKDRKDLVENFDIINQFTIDTMKVLRPSTVLESSKKSNMVFEAILEDEDAKINILKQMNSICSPETYYLTNTSSIPIHFLDEKAGLDGRIIGYHFYNPPAVQKLAELISAQSTKKELVELSYELAKRLRKKIVPSNDIAGFIGNGHFMRDILHAIDETNNLSDTFSLVEAIYAMNKISQDYLVRPMGIFQLMDYVGVDVCQLIMKVMTKHIEGVSLENSLINRLREKGVNGGQYPDGRQKDGFLKYEKNRPSGVYDIENEKYIMFDPEGWTKKVDSKLGPLPENWAPWRKLLRDPKRDEKLKSFFDNLKKMDTLGASLAKNYFHRSKEIGENLVKDGVAQSEEDVNTVMKSGFFHLYGPINDYIS